MNIFKIMYKLSEDLMRSDVPQLFYVVDRYESELKKEERYWEARKIIKKDHLF